MSFCVYAIQSGSGRVYIGQTKDIESRLGLHNSGAVPSTRMDRPWRVIRVERVGTREEARYLEWMLKSSRGKRLKWLADHPQQLS